MNIIMIKIAKLTLLILLFTLVFGLFSVEIKDPDFWWHLKTGEYIYQSGALPMTDPFAFTSLQKDPLNPESKRIQFILNQYWLAQVVFYRTYHFFGFEGIIFLRALLLTLLVFLIFKSIRREGFGIYSSVIFLVPVVMIFRTFTGERPQLFSFLFAFLMIFLLEGFRKRENRGNSSRLAETNRDSVETGGDAIVSSSLNQSQSIAGFYYLLPLPFIMLLWANLHGGFILGILILTCYLITENMKYFMKRFGSILPSRSLKMLNIAGIVAVLASFINPNSYKVFPFLLEFETGRYKSMIIESVSPMTLVRSGFYEPQFIMYFIVLAICVLLFLIHIQRRDLTEGVLVAVLSVMSLSSSRFIPFFCPVALLMIARYGSEIIRKPTAPGYLQSMGRKIELPSAIILSIALIIVINNADLFKRGIRVNKYPEGAARFLKENKIAGNMFNPYVWGGYLIWELYPEYKVFIDGRGLIGEVFFQEVRVLGASRQPVEQLPEWKAILKAYNVDFIITYSVDNFTGRLVPLIPALLNDPAWHLIYMDNISLIFLQESTANKPITDRFSIPKEWLWNEVAIEAALKAQDYGWNVNYWITIGDAFLAKQNYQEAKRAFSKAQMIDPENEKVKQRLDFLRAQGY